MISPVATSARYRRSARAIDESSSLFRRVLKHGRADRVIGTNRRAPSDFPGGSLARRRGANCGPSLCGVSLRLGAAAGRHLRGAAPAAPQVRWRYADHGLHHRNGQGALWLDHPGARLAGSRGSPWAPKAARAKSRIGEGPLSDTCPERQAPARTCRSRSLPNSGLRCTNRPD
jgi:hypothetical protein